MLFLFWVMVKMFERTGLVHFWRKISGGLYTDLSLQAVMTGNRTEYKSNKTTAQGKKEEPSDTSRQGNHGSPSLQQSAVRTQARV